MLANKDIYKEIEKMEVAITSAPSAYDQAVLKSNVLIIKLLHNIRTNMVSVMKHQGIDLVEPADVKKDK